MPHLQKVLFRTMTTAIICIESISCGFAQGSSGAGIAAGIVAPVMLEQKSDMVLVRLGNGDDASLNTRYLISPASFFITGSPHAAYGIMVPPAICVNSGYKSFMIRTEARRTSNGVLSGSGNDGLLIFSPPGKSGAVQALPANDEGPGMLPVTIVYN